MKYWTLFTLRVLARTGLLSSILIWWASQSVVVQMGVPSGIGTFAVGLSPWGPIAYHTPSQDISTLDFFMMDVADADMMERQWRASYTDHTPWLPGISVLSHERVRTETIVQISHWLLCLTFLIATIVTSVRWRKPAAEQEQELADE